MNEDCLAKNMLGVQLMVLSCTTGLIVFQSPMQL